MPTVEQQLKSKVLDVPDFPKPGIVFKDITPLLADPQTWRLAIDQMAKGIAKHEPDLLLAIESRGFIFGAALGLEMGLGVHIARKPGKLPRPTKDIVYQLEYGEDRLEMHDDILSFGTRIAVIDDVLATGGTASAVCELVKSLGGQIACCSFLIELDGLKGSERLADHSIESILHY